MPEHKTGSSAAAAEHVLTLEGSTRLSVGKDLSVQIAQKLRIEVQDSLELVVGQSSVLMKKDGSILIKGKKLSLEAKDTLECKASGDVVLKGGKIAQN